MNGHYDDSPTFTFTTQRQVRRAFWAENHGILPDRRTVRMGDERCYPADTRTAFVDYVDHLARAGQISEALASRVTL